MDFAGALCQVVPEFQPTPGLPTLNSCGNAGDEIHNRDSWFPTVVDGAVGCVRGDHLVTARHTSLSVRAVLQSLHMAAAGSSHAMDARLQAERRLSEHLWSTLPVLADGCMVYGTDRWLCHAAMGPSRPAECGAKSGVLRHVSLLERHDVLHPGPRRCDSVGYGWTGACGGRIWLRLRLPGGRHFVPARHLPGVFAPRGEYFTPRRPRWIAPQRWRITTTERRGYGLARPVTL